jgi:hypothetical protein
VSPKEGETVRHHDEARTSQKIVFLAQRNPLLLIIERSPLGEPTKGTELKSNSSIYALLQVHKNN